MFAGHLWAATQTRPPIVSCLHMVDCRIGRTPPRLRAVRRRVEDKDIALLVWNLGKSVFAGMQLVVRVSVPRRASVICLAWEMGDSCAGAAIGLTFIESHRLQCGFVSSYCRDISERFLQSVRTTTTSVSSVQSSNNKN